MVVTRCHRHLFILCYSLTFLLITYHLVHSLPFLSLSHFVDLAILSFDPVSCHIFFLFCFCAVPAGIFSFLSFSLFLFSASFLSLLPLFIFRDSFLSSLLLRFLPKIGFIISLIPPPLDVHQLPLVSTHWRFLFYLSVSLPAFSFALFSTLLLTVRFNLYQRGKTHHPPLLILLLIPFPSSPFRPRLFIHWIELGVFYPVTPQFISPPPPFSIHISLASCSRHQMLLVSFPCLHHKVRHHRHQTPNMQRTTKPRIRETPSTSLKLRLKASPIFVCMQVAHECSSLPIF